MNMIIRELLEKGFRLEIYNDEHGEICYSLPGFYKSSGVILRENIFSVTAFSRYNQMDEITSFRDLVLLNYQWWQNSKDRSDGWSKPDPAWLPFLVEEGLVKEIKETVVKYE